MYKFDYFAKFQVSSSKRKRTKTESATVLMQLDSWEVQGNKAQFSLLTSICLKLMVNFCSNDFCKLFMNDILPGSLENIMILWAD